MLTRGEVALLADMKRALSHAECSIDRARQQFLRAMNAIHPSNLDIAAIYGVAHSARELTVAAIRMIECSEEKGELVNPPKDRTLFGN